MNDYWYNSTINLGKYSYKIIERHKRKKSKKDKIKLTEIKIKLKKNEEELKKLEKILSPLLNKEYKLNRKSYSLDNQQEKILKKYKYEVTIKEGENPNWNVY